MAEVFKLAKEKLQQEGVNPGEAVELELTGQQSSDSCAFCATLHESVQKIIALDIIIGDAAGATTFFGIICFLLSVVCLTKATQPPSVWISAIVACSCIVMVPLLNKLLSISHLSASISLSRIYIFVSLISVSVGLPNVFDAL